jgi:restriction endonuclease Mrr
MPKKPDKTKSSWKSLLYTTPDVGRQAEINELREAFERIFKTLTYREREIVKLRYGLGDGYTYSLEQVGEIFRISPEEVRQIEVLCLRKLQHPVRSHALKGFVDAAPHIMVKPQAPPPPPAEEVLLVPFDDPTDTLTKAASQSQEALIEYLAKHPDEIHAVHSRRFEEIICEVFTSFGFTVELTKQTRDGGLDLICFKTDVLGIATKYVIEVKRYAPQRRISVHLVRAFYAVKVAEAACHGIFATTSTFTKDAWKFSKKQHILNLHLRDKQDVMGWIQTYMKLREQGGVLLTPKSV